MAVCVLCMCARGQLRTHGHDMNESSGVRLTKQVQQTECNPETCVNLLGESFQVQNRGFELV